ncbi:unnamed protein product [Rotaria socialis]|uniref:Uncharacterized protein n=1 Tax=Rotaria socialis TaxID=392032 RepID=A0A820ZZZ8_9BILA|nr:unnamed protein product [Rotaria socialis]CAF4569820.1 unnamed protein product [Rotaria socialis]
MDSGRKAGQFNIYSNQAETNLLYRIESYYSPMQKIDLRTYPDKKVIGRLNSHQLGIWYQATYEIFDIRNKTNKWFNGSIKRQSTWFHDEYHVNLAERKITMKNRAFSGRFKLYNEANSLLAMFKMRRN